MSFPNTILLVSHHYFQICDDSNQAKGFAIVGMSGGIARLTVSQSHFNIVVADVLISCHCRIHFIGICCWRIFGSASQQIFIVAFPFFLQVPV